MRSFPFSKLLPLCLVLAISGCSPWQTLELSDYLQSPNHIKELAPDGIRVTTIYGELYEGMVSEESNAERLVVQLRRPGSERNLSGITISIPKAKVSAIQRWMRIF